MPKGETPGPFYLGTTGYGICERENPSVFPHADFLSHVPAAERRRIIDLLNKGTHYDALLEALRDCVEGFEGVANGLEHVLMQLNVSGDTTPRDIRTRMAEYRALIAKAEGRDDG